MKVTADQILEYLLSLHRGNGWVCIPELRAGTGYGSSVERKIDLWVLNCWPSLEYARIAYEIKVSKTDFFHDIKDKIKRKRFRHYAHQFYYVAPEGLLTHESIPDDCGLIEVIPHTDKFRWKHRTPVPSPHRESDPDWSLVGSICRSVLTIKKNGGAQ